MKNVSRCFSFISKAPIVKYSLYQHMKMSIKNEVCKINKSVHKEIGKHIFEFSDCNNAEIYYYWPKYTLRA